MEKKKAKLNDKKLNKKIKNNVYVSEEQKEIRNFILILLGVIIVVLIVYGVSKIFIKDDKDNANQDEVTSGTIDYDVVSIGTMLNRNEDEYYVMIYDIEDTQAVYYSAIINIYSNKENSKRLYYCDLGNKLNEGYRSEDGNSNPNAKKIDELALSDLTLIKVKKGKIVKYLDNIDTIKSELGL